MAEQHCQMCLKMKRSKLMFLHLQMVPPPFRCSTESFACQHFVKRRGCEDGLVQHPVQTHYNTRRACGTVLAINRVAGGIYNRRANEVPLFCTKCGSTTFPAGSIELKCDCNYSSMNWKWKIVTKFYWQDYFITLWVNWLDVPWVSGQHRETWQVFISHIRAPCYAYITGVYYKTQ